MERSGSILEIEFHHIKYKEDRKDRRYLLTLIEDQHKEMMKFASLNRSLYDYLSVRVEESKNLLEKVEESILVYERMFN